MAVHVAGKGTQVRVFVVAIECRPHTVTIDIGGLSRNRRTMLRTPRRGRRTCLETRGVSRHCSWGAQNVATSIGEDELTEPRFMPVELKIIAISPALETAMIPPSPCSRPTAAMKSSAAL
jgi:hypothetical protein